MSKIVKHSTRHHGYSLLGPDHLPIGEEELARRTADGGGPRPWRSLKSGEIDQLQQQGNWSADWGSVMVCEPFHASLIRQCRFFGLVRIGSLEHVFLEGAGLRIPAGLYESTLVSCDLGNNVAIDQVAWLAHAIVGDEAILQNIGKISTSRHAVFGNGLARGAEGERNWIAVGNENGGRKILPFEGMIPADAWLGSRYRENMRLMDRLRELTDAWGEAQGLHEPGHYSRFEEQVIATGCGTLTDLRAGKGATIAGAARLENVTLLSDEAEPCSVESGAVLVDGIAGYGCRVGDGVQARRFVLGTRSRLLSGARVAECVVGDNSTIACAEISNNLLFPAHEQHHNNSFLIAATLQGQSNIAAGATLGSNHNSRAADGEILAGRGFWPGLCTSLKHNCRFASFTLLAKADYPHELDVRLPFSLLSAELKGLTLAPAWWFLHNMYAVARNAWKGRDRDKRVHVRQRIVFDALAPDTAEEILTAIEWLELRVGRAQIDRESQPPLKGKDIAAEAVQARGRQLLLHAPAEADALEIFDGGIECSRRPVRILKPGSAHAIYREMLHHYAMVALIDGMDAHASPLASTLGALLTPDLASSRERRWTNLGGQLVPGSAMDLLIESIASGAIGSWHAVHAEYERLWQEYPAARCRHAGAILLALNGARPGRLDEAPIRGWLTQALATQEKIAVLVERSRAKDFTNPFRRATMQSDAEMQAVLGRLEDDPAILRAREEAEKLRLRLKPFLAGD